MPRPQHAGGEGEGPASTALAADAAAAPPSTRRDAARNRARIVDAAHAAFVELGVHAPVEEIARRAGVGVGTVYRRFPDRSRLAEAVFLERGRAYLALIDGALAADDPAAAFRAYLQRLCELQARDRALTDLLTVALPTSPRLQSVRVEIYRRQGELIRRAQRAGGVRDDFTPEDVILILLAHSGVVRALGSELPSAPARFAALALQALAPAAAAPLPAPPSSAQLLEALQQRPVVLQRGAPRRDPDQHG